MQRTHLKHLRNLRQLQGREELRHEAPITLPSNRQADRDRQTGRQAQAGRQAGRQAAVLTFSSTSINLSTFRQQSLWLGLVSRNFSYVACLSSRQRKSWSRREERQCSTSCSRAEGGRK